MKYFGTYLAVGFFWLLHWLPLPVIRGFSALIGKLLYPLAGSRRKVALTNLRLCFPQLSEEEREQIARRHFVYFVQALFDRPLFWWASERRLRRLLTLRGLEYLDNGSTQAAILVVPHFVGLDAGGTRMTMDRRMSGIFQNQTNPVINELIRRGRLRFNPGVLMSRQDGLRKAIKCLRDGIHFFYAADMDFGPDEALFVPFFGVPTATVTGLPRLAQIGRARVVPLISRMTQAGYDIELQPAWENYPTGDLEADVRRFNAFIEGEVLKSPEQYFWVHKRFKTRPPGVASVYG